jgi:hypothetical protein
MSSTYKWITDRSPTEHDVDVKDCIMIPEFRAGLVQEAVSLTLQDYLRNFKEGHRWCHSNRKRKLHTIQTVQPPTEFMKMCASCRYWQKRAKPGGDCRRNSPQAELVRVDLLDIERVSVWPGTDDADWCGEWEACQ